MPETPSQELIDLILHGREERNLEYKGPMSWKQRDVKVEITRCILGMANIRDGGFIVIGVEQQGNSFVPVGMPPEQMQSFTQDKVDDYVKNYPDPFVETEITQVPYANDHFVVIQIREFEELPVICRKAGKRTDGTQRLRQGAIYIRPRGKAETAEISTQVEMREIVELAADKSLRRLIERMGRAGIKITFEEVPSDAEQFNEQLGEVR